MRAAAAAALAAVALAVGLIPPALDAYLLFEFTLVVIAALVVTGLNLMGGLGGQVSLGQWIFVAIGSYSTAVLSVRTTGDWAPWAGVLLAVGLAGVAGALLSAVCLRLPGPSLSIVTLIAVPVVFQTIANLDGLTGGFTGLVDVPTPVVPGATLPRETVLSFGAPLSPYAFYVLALAALAAATAAVWNVRRSRWGRALVATRLDEPAARAVGLPLTRIRVSAFTFGAGCAGLAGWFQVHLIGAVGPGAFPAARIRDSFLYVIAMIVGGRGTLAGPIIGAAALEGLRASLARFPHAHGMVQAGLALAFIFLLPRGIAGEARRIAAGSRWWERLRAPIPPPAAGPAVPAVPPAETPALAARGVTVRFGGVAANDELSLEVGAGEVVALIGPNGSGKTTFVDAVTGVRRPDAGAVTLFGAESTGLPPSAVARWGVARTFQVLHTWGELTVLDNVMLGAHARLRTGFVGAALGRGRDEDGKATARSVALLAFVGLDALAGRPAGECSHGQRRRLDVARALAARPTLLLLDEPTAGLDAAARRDVEELIGAIAAHGVGVLLVEHHLEVVERLASRVAVLDVGRVIAEGSLEELRRDPRVEETYLGVRPLERRSVEGAAGGAL